MRLKHYSIRTEQAYASWIKRYLHCRHRRHPRDMGRAEIEAFLTDLGRQRNVAASTPNEAFNALLCLYRQVLAMDIINAVDAIRPTRPVRRPAVLTGNETLAVIQALRGAQSR
ncbi:MAG: phage integrase N-terminal SAM-like domain-containing protein [Desulfobacterales bacterium]|nr:MAG: phage integrase N-terminal SAM-like domain-containing protein [Desulfobacterales bacterium]